MSSLAQDEVRKLSERVRFGYKRSIELSKEFDLYRQDYCGCVYSLRDELERKKKKTDNN